MTNKELKKANDLSAEIIITTSIVNYFSEYNDEATGTFIVIDRLDGQKTGLNINNKDDIVISKEIADFITKKFQKKLDILQEEFDNF
jgi:hypothetical protein